MSSAASSRPVPRPALVLPEYRVFEREGRKYVTLSGKDYRLPTCPPHLLVQGRFPDEFVFLVSYLPAHLRNPEGILFAIEQDLFEWFLRTDA